MKNCLLLLASITSFNSFLFSQSRTEDFKITLPENKVSGSLYRKIELIDAREDTVNMGFVQLGAFNTKARIVTKTPLPAQLTEVIQALTDSTAINGTLYFQLRKLSFAEITGSFTEKGLFYLRGSLFSEKFNGFREISSIDTLVQVKAMDVTKGLLRNAGSVIIDYISTNLQKEPADSMNYGLIELVKPDSIEKTKIRIYNSEQYSEGLYTNWQSISRQIPDRQMTVTAKKDVIKRVEITDSSGKLQKINSRDIYGIVYKGDPYIATTYGYYMLTKSNSDLYFTGKIKVSADPAAQMAAGMMFGIVGSILASNNTSYYLIKLDHINGSFIQIRRIPEPAVQ